MAHDTEKGTTPGGEPEDGQVQQPDRLSEGKEEAEADVMAAGGRGAPRRKARKKGKRKFIGGLLSALIPGAGHVYFGLFRKGVSLLFLIALDISALLYFSSLGMRINVPLLLLLGLLIPVLYFYNVYDALQAADQAAAIRRVRDRTKAEGRKPRMRLKVREPELSFGLLLLLGGTLMVLFRLRPPWLKVFFEQYAGLSIGILLALAGLALILREVYRAFTGTGKRPNERRAGRHTASLLLITAGSLLAGEFLLGADLLPYLLDWWPVFAVLWGIEYLTALLLGRRSKTAQPSVRKRLRLDIRGLLAAAVLAFSVFVIAEQDRYLHLWNKVSLNLSVAAVEYGEAEGRRFEKAPLIVPVELNTAKLSVEGVNGDLLLHRAPVQDIEIRATVWFDELDGALAEAAAEQTFLQVEEGPHIKITPVVKTYGETGKRQPKVDLQILLPEHRRFDFDLRTMNGSITLQNVAAIENIALETGAGNLILHRVLGDVKGSTLNGAVKARTLQGDVELSTGNGEVGAWDVSGSVKLSTAVGNAEAAEVSGDLRLTTKNGNVDISGASMGVYAESLNGGIQVSSDRVGGNWEVYSAVGDITLNLPDGGDYAVEGTSSYGAISTDFYRFNLKGRSLSGESGTGEHHIEVEGNSNINVMKY